MISPLSFLQDNLKVIPLDNDLVEVTVILPEDFLHQYTQLINSLYGFFQFVQKQNKLSKAIKSRESGAIALQAKKNITEYHQRLVKLYDQYIGQGLYRNNSIKQISADLRFEHHPWSSPDLVRPSLIEAGRAGRVGRPRGEI